jgi:chromosome segregation ATPase
MKTLYAIVAGVAVVVLGILFFNANRETRHRLTLTQQQLTTASNDLASARNEIAAVRTEMHSQVDRLQQSVTELTADKAQAKEQIETLSDALAGTRAELENLTRDKQRLTAEIAAVSDQLALVERNLAELEKTHATTVNHLTAMREEYVVLTKQKAALEAKLSDLKALKAQIREVKREMHERKVAELKRLDRAEMAMGNRGFLMKDGEWMVTPTTGRYPLIQDIHRESR